MRTRFPRSDNLQTGSFCQEQTFGRDVFGRFCGKDEGALGEVGDLLYLTTRKTVRLGQHGQWIPAKEPLGEDITGVVSVGYRIRLQSDVGILQ